MYTGTTYFSELGDKVVIRVIHGEKKDTVGVIVDEGNCFEKD